VGPPSYSTNVVTESPEVTSEVGRKVSTQKNCICAGAAVCGVIQSWERGRGPDMCGRRMVTRAEPHLRMRCGLIFRPAQADRENSAFLLGGFKRQCGDIIR
jgi:hypothetical protein